MISCQMYVNVALWTQCVIHVRHVHNIYFNTNLANNSALNFNAQIYMLEQQGFTIYDLVDARY